jgi:RNA polymerase sigma factor (sigma-70 family)
MATPPSASDEALLALYREGEMEAFNQLYQRHEGALYRYVLRMVQHRHIAGDLFQDVWMALIRAPQHSLEGKPFAPWLYTVTRHRVIDYLRLDKNRVVAEPEQDLLIDSHEEDALSRGALAQVAPHYDLADLLHNQRMGEALMKCVQELPSVQREAFVLQAETDLSIEDIAELTQTPIETVKSRLRYARNTIRKQMEAWR